MKYEVKDLLGDSASGTISEHLEEVFLSISGLSEKKIETFFVSKAMGSRSKSLAGTIRTLVLNDLQLKGWTINWAPFKGSGNYESAIWNFDAAKLVEEGGLRGWLTLEISFDNRVAIGTHLVKASVANHTEFRRDIGVEPVLHHCIIAASKGFKLVSGLDNSVASSEEFTIAAEPYSKLNLINTSLISLQALETLEVLQRKSDGRTKSRLLNLDAS